MRRTTNQPFGELLGGSCTHEIFGIFFSKKCCYLTISDIKEDSKFDTNWIKVTLDQMIMKGSVVKLSNKYCVNLKNDGVKCLREMYKVFIKMNPQHEVSDLPTLYAM